VARLRRLRLPAVIARVRRLLQAGYVREAGRTEARRGRRARLLGFDGKFGCVAGIDVGGHQVSAAVADLSGEVVMREGAYRHECG